jgi:cysteine desulfurase family protein (TIGR01976 family)
MLEPGDKLLVTHLDHDANITPWTRISEDRGAEVLWVDFDVETGKLDLDSLDRALEQKPKIVSVGYASNALGTINPVKEIIQKSKAVGALTFIDAVQFAPHGVIDVQELDCDFLVCSSYKFYGPHMGILYGKYDLLEKTRSYKVRPAPALPPGKWETGTANFEGICGIHGALDHISWLGEKFGNAYAPLYASNFSGYALELRKGMAAIREHEAELSLALLEMFSSLPEITVYGNTDPDEVGLRVPTFSINMEGIHPRKLAEELDKKNIYVWDGDYYAVNVVQKLGLTESGGMVRVGAGHYNTVDEVELLGKALKEIAENIKE